MKRLSFLLLSCLVGLFLSTSAFADSELRRALAHMPARAAEGPGFSASFVDLAAVRALGLETGKFDADFARRLQVDRHASLVAYAVSDDAAWQGFTGLAKSDLSSFLAYPDKSYSVIMWRFVAAEKIAPFLNGLESRGFQTRDGILANGEPFQPPAAPPDLSNPFVGSFSFASMIVPFSAGVVQAGNPELATKAAGVAAKDSVLALPLVSASVDALEKTVGASHLVQAVMLNPDLWSPGVDLTRLFQKNNDMDAVAAEAAKIMAQKRAPPTIGAILADVQTPDKRGVILVLPYPACDIARQAGDIFSTRWKTVADSRGSTPAERLKLEPVVEILEGKEACSTVLSLLGAPDGSPQNSAFTYIIGAIVMRELHAL